MAAAMLAGYFWLAIAGPDLIVGSLAPFAYDLTLHVVLIGFVLPMVFGHALIIFPAIIGLAIRYRALMYVPLGLLHLSVAARYGRSAGIDELRVTSGPPATASLMLFATALAAGRRTHPPV